MLIGKPGPAKTHICRAAADHIDVRGHDLTGDLMGRLSFTDYFFLLMTGREPNPTSAISSTSSSSPSPSTA